MVFFWPKRDNVRRTKLIVPEQKEEILVCVADNPEISTRILAVGFVASRSLVLRIIFQKKLYPYRFTPAQNFLEADLPARLQFARLVALVKTNIRRF